MQHGKKKYIIRLGASQNEPSFQVSCEALSVEHAAQPAVGVDTAVISSAVKSHYGVRLGISADPTDHAFVYPCWAHSRAEAVEIAISKFRMVWDSYTFSAQIDKAIIPRELYQWNQIEAASAEIFLCEAALDYIQEYVDSKNIDNIFGISEEEGRAILEELISRQEFFVITPHVIKPSIHVTADHYEGDGMARHATYHVQTDGIEPANQVVSDVLLILASAMTCGDLLDNSIYEIDASLPGSAAMRASVVLHPLRLSNVERLLLCTGNIELWDQLQSMLPPEDRIYIGRPVECAAPTLVAGFATKSGDGPMMPVC